MLKYGMMTLFFVVVIYPLNLKPNCSVHQVKTIKEVRIWSSGEGCSVGGRRLHKTFQNVCIQVIQRADGSGSDATSELAAQRPAGEKALLH